MNEDVQLEEWADDGGEKKPALEIASTKHQIKALFIKSAIVQRRRIGFNICQAIFPIILLGAMIGLQGLVNNAIEAEFPEQAFGFPREPFFVVQSTPKTNVTYKYENSTIFPFPVPVLDTWVSGTPFVPEILWAAEPGIRDVVNNLISTYYALNNEIYLKIPNDTLTSSQTDVRFIPSISVNYTWTEVGSSDEIDSNIYDNFLAGDPRFVAAIYVNALNTTTGEFSFGVVQNRTLVAGDLDTPSIISRITTAISIFFLSPIVFLGWKEFPSAARVFTFDLASAIGPFFSLLILHQTLPVILSNVVYEKEARIRQLMKMMGLNIGVYWLVHYIFAYIYYAITITIFYLFGFFFGFAFFRDNGFVPMFLLLFIWGHTLIALSFLFTVMFGKSRTSIVFGYFYMIICAFLAVYLIDEIVRDEQSDYWTIFGISLLPSFAVYRGLAYLSTEVLFNGGGIGNSELNIPKFSMLEVYCWLILQWAFFLLFALWLDQVAPSKYGVRRHPCFCFGFGKRKITETISDEPEDPEGEDVLAERRNVNDSSVDLAVRIKGLRKEFPGAKGTKVALHNLDMGIKENECLGMLGHNGAGKTTLISILSGLFEPSSGTAEIYGLDIGSDINKIYRIMGVCPQHDILWETLTGREHLMFYGRLKGLRGKRLKTAVEKSLAEVNLLKSGNKKVKGYSGGMKRRLSVAISLIGDPKVIFLDEPSTGLDPKSRRTLWSIINEHKKGKSMILTTHSMEEAEALCDRICVMAKGRLESIGISADLKDKYGAGFNFTIQVPEAMEETAHEKVMEMFPHATLVNSLAGTRNYEIPKGDVVLSTVFARMAELKDELQVKDWGISTSTLEEVFLKLTGNKYLK